MPLHVHHRSSCLGNTSTECAGIWRVMCDHIDPTYHRKFGLFNLKLPAMRRRSTRSRPVMAWTRLSHVMSRMLRNRPGDARSHAEPGLKEEALLVTSYGNSNVKKIEVFDHLKSTYLFPPLNHPINGLCSLLYVRRLDLNMLKKTTGSLET